MSSRRKPVTQTRQPQTPSAEPAWPDSHVWLACAALCALTWLAYANSFQAGMVLDNKVLLLEDPRVRAVTRENVSLILHQSYWWPYIESALYRPVTTFSYLFNYAVLGNQDRPAGYHAINLLLHTGNVLLMFAVALRLSRQLWPAFFVSAIWAVHPLSTEGVTNIIGRADLLAAMAILGAFFAHIRAADSEGGHRLAWLLTVMLVTTAGVFSKESAVAVLGIVLLYDVAFRWSNTPASKLALGWLAVVVPLVWLWYQRSVVLAGVSSTFPVVDNPIIGASFWTGRLTAVAVIARYMWLIVWPQRLSADYSFNQIPLASGRVEDWIAWMVVAAAVVGTLAAFRGSRLLFFVSAAAFTCLLPASNLIIVSGTIMAERLVYLSSAGVIACVVIGLYAPALARLKPIATLALCVVVVACAARTWVRNEDWRDDLTLWTSAVNISPRSFKSHGALAEALYNSDPTRGNLEQVIAEKELSLAILRDAPDPVQVSLPYREAAAYYLEYGEWLQQRDKSASAVARSTDAFGRAASNAQQYLALIEQERLREGSSPGKAFSPLAGSATKDTADGYRLLSSANARLSDRDAAVEAARRARALEPLNPISYRSVAAALVDQRRFDEAAVALLTGVMLTGNAELRLAAIDLYRSGLDVKGCAVTTGTNGPTLDSSCEIVRQHMCGASRDAAGVQRARGRADLAQGIDALAAREFRCGADR